MIYLDLFLTFLQIGAFTFGGGYAMIPLVREAALKFGLAESEIMNFIAVSESTPGPIAINMATFVGSKEGGILGSVLATLGIVLPAFCIILAISSILKNLLKYKGVEAFLGGVRPTVVALIVSTGVTMFLSNVIKFTKIGDPLLFDINLIIFGIILLILIWRDSVITLKKFYKKLRNFPSFCFCLYTLFSLFLYWLGVIP